MKTADFVHHVHELEARALPMGGFSFNPEGDFRPDATAWAILILQASNPTSGLVKQARTRLVMSQGNNGCVPIAPEHPEAIWPTALAILAWHRSPEHREAQDRAIQFLLNTTGNHWKQSAPSVIAHDPSIQGWPWTAATHSWIEPTALSIFALDVTGYGDHSRVQEAVRMLFNRQMSRGGWNYGNPAVFGRELHPFPETTGLVLDALRNFAQPSQVQNSLHYLSNHTSRIRTPLSLGWTLLGLGAWKAKPLDYRIRVKESFALQDRYGTYDTVSLCVMLAGLISHSGLRGLIQLEHSYGEINSSLRKDHVP